MRLVTDRPEIADDAIAGRDARTVKGAEGEGGGKRTLLAEAVFIMHKKICFSSFVIRLVLST